MGRFFAFGCSYTSYSWPTWADLLQVHFDNAENWGMAGIGNSAIAERIAEANVKNNFNKDDVIIVQWSSHLRNDFWNPLVLPERPGSWKTSGSIFNYINQPLYNQQWIDTFFSEPGFFMHTLNNITLVQELLKSSGATWFMTSIGDIRNLGADLTDNGWGAEDIFLTTKDKIKQEKFLAWKKFPQYEIYNKLIWENNKDHWLTPLNLFAYSSSEPFYDFIDTTNKSNTYYDPHPTTKHYVMWIESILKNKINITDNEIKNMHMIAELVKKTHTKFKFDQLFFRTKLIEREDFSMNILPNWPDKILGF